MKTVLLIAYYYPPLGGMGTQRALKWARYLADFGWHAIVLTPDQGAYFTDSTLDDGTAYGVEIVRTPLYHLNPLAAKTPATPGAVAASPASSAAPGATLKSRLKNLVKTWLYFPDGQNGWFFPALRAGDKLLKTRQIDAIVSTSFPVTAHFVAARLARKYDVPWVADYRDLWTQNQTDDLHVSRARQRFDQRAERRLLRKAAAVTTVSKGQGRELQKVTGKKKRAELIRNGFDSEDFRDLEYQRPDKWTLTFVGTYYSFYAPQTLFAVLARLISEGRIDRDKVRFRVVGDPSAELRALLQQSGLEGITEFTGFVSYRTALQHQVNASLLLLMVTSDRSKPGVIHGKTFEYLGAGRPILTLAPPEFEVAEIVRESGAGTVVGPHDEKGIKECLLRSYDEYTSGADNGNAPADIARYERRAGAQQLAQLLDELSFKTKKTLPHELQNICAFSTEVVAASTNARLDWRRGSRRLLHRQSLRMPQLWWEIPAFFALWSRRSSGAPIRALPALPIVRTSPAVMALSARAHRFIESAKIGLTLRARVFLSTEI